MALPATNVAELRAINAAQKLKPSTDVQLVAYRVRAEAQSPAIKKAVLAALYEDVYGLSDV